MLVPILLLTAHAGNREAKPAGARGSMPAPCNTNTLLNEFVDCHIACGVHTNGAAAGSSCSTNFCGSDGICCRKGVTAGVCDGAVGCDGWHCCVCTTSSTHSPTGAPLVQIKGDPFTTYKGKKTQFYMPTDQKFKLLGCGSMQVFGRARNSYVNGDDQQWFDMFEIRSTLDASEPLITITARDMSSAKIAASPVVAGDQVDAAVTEDKTVVAKMLEQTRLLTAMKKMGMKTLTTLNITVQGLPVTTTGDKFDLGSFGVNATITQDASRPMGNGFMEKVFVETSDLGMELHSSVAGKFDNEIDRVRNLHVDVSFSKINANFCTGALPEIWGVRPMSRATAKLLMPPMRK